MWNILLHMFLITLLPFVFAVGLLRGGKTRWEWWTNVALALAVTSWAFVIGSWGMAGYVFRVLIPVLAVVFTLVGWGRIRRIGNVLPRGTVLNFSVILNLFLALIFVVQTGIGIAGYFTKETAIELVFPLQNGVYYVGQGGRTVMINYHSAYPPQAYALDIGRLNASGYRAAGVYPSELDKYAIFGDPVYSPCAGEVIAARDGLPDHNPPEHDAGRPEGNFVAIRCHGVDVLLAHLQQHSVLASEGELVTAGQPLGKVGNSGNTTEPHLHIHAERRVEFTDGTEKWVGVPMRFDGRFLVRNSIVRAR